MNEVVAQSSKQHIVADNVMESTVENFNTYFTNIGPNLAKILPAHNLPTHSFAPIVHSFVMHDIDLHEIFNAVNKPNIGKAAGPDGITVRSIQEKSDILGTIIFHLFNHSLRAGIYASTLKTAKVTPILKNGDKYDPSCYSPI